MNDFFKLTSSRRDFLRLSATAALIAPVAVSTQLVEAQSANAAGLTDSLPSDVTVQPSTPAFHRFRIGEIEAMIVSDGRLDFPTVQPVWAGKAKPEEVERTLRRAFLPTKSYAVAANVLLLRLGTEVVLVDTGNVPQLGPTTGHLRRNLRAAGVTEAQVTAVVFTHGHPDHLGGTTNADGELVFPNAKLFATRRDFTFWTQAAPDLSKTGLTPEFRAVFLDAARRNWAAHREKFTLLEPGDTLFGALTVVDAPGHTPGHAALSIGSGADQLLHVGDALPDAYLTMARPEWGTAFDTDPAQTVATRRAMLRQVEPERTRVLGFHMPFPGLGHVRRQDEGYEWVPEPVFST